MLSKLEKRILAGILTAAMSLSLWPVGMTSVQAEEDAVAAEEDVIMPEIDAVEAEGDAEDLKEGSVSEETEEFVTDYAEENDKAIEVGETYHDSGFRIEHKLSVSETGYYKLTIKRGDNVYNMSSYIEDKSSQLVSGELDCYKLCGGTEYYVNFSVLGFYNDDTTPSWTWSIDKMEKEEISDPLNITCNSMEFKYYEFKPDEDGIYALRGRDTSVFGGMCTIDGIYLSSNGKNTFSLKAGQAYYIFLDTDGASEECSWFVQKRIEETVVLGEIYTSTPEEQKCYTFTAEKTGDYMINSESYKAYIADLNSENYIQDKRYSDRIRKRVTLIEGHKYLIDSYATKPLQWSVISLPENENWVYDNRSDGTAGLLYYKGDEECVVIPDMVDGKTVTLIGEGAFPYGKSAKKIVIPDSVREIEAWAFECDNLEKVTLGSGVTSVAYRAFDGCRNLSEIDFPDSLESIGGYAFGGWYGESSVNNTKWWEAQSKGAVYAGSILYLYKGDMPEGTELTVKEGTKGIAGFAMGDQANLTSVVLPQGLKTIGEKAFFECAGLKSITIPASVTRLEKYSVGYEWKYEDSGIYKKVYEGVVDGFVIRGAIGSAAETYAKENGIIFDPIIQKGDLDQSGKVDISDLRLMLRIVCGKVEVGEVEIRIGDIASVNGADETDGEITIADLRKLLRYICNKIESL